MQTTNRLTGTEAIEYAEANGLTLSKYNDPIEDAREGLTPAEARKIAAEDPSLIYFDLADEPSKTVWAVMHADGSVIGHGDTFRSAAIEALREEIEAKGLDAANLSDEELQGALDTNDFSAARQ